MFLFSIEIGDMKDRAGNTPGEMMNEEEKCFTLGVSLHLQTPTQFLHVYGIEEEKCLRPSNLTLGRW